MAISSCRTKVWGMSWPSGMVSSPILKEEGSPAIVAAGLELTRQVWQGSTQGGLARQSGLCGEEANADTARSGTCHQILLQDRSLLTDDHPNLTLDASLCMEGRRPTGRQDASS